MLLYANQNAIKNHLNFIDHHVICVCVYLNVFHFKYFKPFIFSSHFNLIDFIKLIAVFFLLFCKKNVKKYLIKFECMQKNYVIMMSLVCMCVFYDLMLFWYNLYCLFVCFVYYFIYWISIQIDLLMWFTI